MLDNDILSNKFRPFSIHILVCPILHIRAPTYDTNCIHKCALIDAMIRDFVNEWCHNIWLGPAYHILANVRLVYLHWSCYTPTDARNLSGSLCLLSSGVLDKDWDLPVCQDSLRLYLAEMIIKSILWILEVFSCLLFNDMLNIVNWS